MSRPIYSWLIIYENNNTQIVSGEYPPDYEDYNEDARDVVAIIRKQRIYI